MNNNYRLDMIDEDCVLVFPHYYEISKDEYVIIVLGFSDFYLKDQTIEKYKIYNFGYSLYLTNNELDSYKIDNIEKSKKYIDIENRKNIKDIIYKNLDNILNFHEFPIIFRGFLPVDNFYLERYRNITKIFEEHEYSFSKHYSFFNIAENNTYSFLLHSKSPINYKDYEFFIENRKKLFLNNQL